MPFIRLVNSTQLSKTEKDKLIEIQNHKMPRCPGCGKPMTLCIDPVDENAVKYLTNKTVKFMASYGCLNCRDWFTGSSFGTSIVEVASKAYDIASRRASLE